MGKRPHDGHTMDTYNDTSKPSTGHIIVATPWCKDTSVGVCAYLYYILQYIVYDARCNVCNGLLNGALITFSQHVFILSEFENLWNRRARLSRASCLAVRLGACSALFGTSQTPNEKSCVSRWLRQKIALVNFFRNLFNLAFLQTSSELCFSTK